MLILERRFQDQSINKVQFNRQYNHNQFLLTLMTSPRENTFEPQSLLFESIFQPEIILSLNYQNLHQLPKPQIVQTLQPPEISQSNQLRIKRRTIQLNFGRKNLKRVANIPKSIITNFFKYLQEYQSSYTYNQHYLNTHETLNEWFANDVDLNLEHLAILFGQQSPQCYQNRRVLRKMIGSKMWKMVGLGTKVLNTLTYMVCLQKYTARLCNPQLSGRIQI